MPKGAHPRYIIVVLAVLLAVLAYSFAPIFIKALLADGVNAQWIATIRLCAVAFIMSAFTISQSKYREELRAISKENAFTSILSGAFLAGHFVTWVLALKHTTSLASTAIICTQTVFSAIFSMIFLKEKQSKAIWVGILPSVVGTLIISWSDAGTIGNMSGAFFAITSSVLVSAYYVTGRIARRSVGLVSYTWIVYFSGAVFLLAYSLVTAAHDLQMPSTKAWLLLGGLVVICTFFGHTVINWALKHAQAAFVSTMTLLQPVLTYLWSAIFLVEVVGKRVLLGAILIIIGIAMYIPYNKRELAKCKK